MTTHFDQANGTKSPSNVQRESNVHSKKGATRVKPNQHCVHQYNKRTLRRHGLFGRVAVQKQYLSARHRKNRFL